MHTFRYRCVLQVQVCECMQSPVCMCLFVCESPVDRNTESIGKSTIVLQQVLRVKQCDAESKLTCCA